MRTDLHYCKECGGLFTERHDAQTKEIAMISHWRADGDRAEWQCPACGKWMETVER